MLVAIDKDVTGAVALYTRAIEEGNSIVCNGCTGVHSGNRRGRVFGTHPARLRMIQFFFSIDIDRKSNL